jgi:hypothetical protein
MLSQGFSGYSLAPVQLRWETPSNEPLPILWEIQVRGWAGIAPPESGVTRIERCHVCGRQRYTPFTNPQQIIDQNQWDGSDFFMVWPMPRYTFITHRVAVYIQQLSISGASIIPLIGLRLPRSLTPGGLRNWMDIERATKLGIDLDIY